MRKGKFLKIFTITMLLCVRLMNGQYLISTGTYNQNFGTSSLAAWTDNVTFLGWYISNSAAPQWGGELNITAAAPTNTGKNYAYTCNGGSDRKIGSRASGGSGTCYFGVLMQNQTGLTIQSFYVTFTAFQMSRGGNTSANANILAFEYIISAAPIAVNAAGGTPVASLAYTQTQFTTTATTSSQTEGFPCTVSELRSDCITASLPNNSYILFRWVDPDDPANDPHFAIDDLSIAFDLTGATCTNFLPLELINFNARLGSSGVILDWRTENERNCDHFDIERSDDGQNFASIGNVKAKNGHTQKNEYSFLDGEKGSGELKYYRLKQVDVNGFHKYSKMISIYRKDDELEIKIFPNPSSNGQFIVRTNDQKGIFCEIQDYSGKSLITKHLENGNIIDVEPFGKGVYILKVSNNNTQVVKKLVFN